MRSPKLLLLRALRIFIEIVDALAIVSIFVVIAPPLIMHFNPGTIIGVITPVRRTLEGIQAPLTRLVHAHIPHEFHGTDVTGYILAFFFVLVVWASRTVLHRLRVAIMVQEGLQKVAEAEEAARIAGVAGKLAAIEVAIPTDRAKVLEVYAQAKRILDGQKRTVSFLAVDVVNSTGMKTGEDQAIAEHDFRQYRKLVEGHIAHHKALKAAWTPDGVMICFDTLPDAVVAAQELLVGLKAFNQTKSIKADFKIRCGVNAGEVLYDETLPMEEMSDGVIDLAGHMQKYAEPNTIFVAKDLLSGQNLPDFRPSGRNVDGREAYLWSMPSSV